MRFRVRSQGRELELDDYAELQRLYRCGFISDEDEICRIGTDRWLKAGRMDELKPLKPRPWVHGNEFAWLMLAIAVGTLILLFVMRR